MKLKSNVKNIGRGLLWSTRSFSLSADSMLLTFLTFFATDTLGLNIGVIGTMLLVAKIVDALTNLVFAYIVDNLHFKSGKGRPYEILLIPAWICTFVLFGIPVGWSAILKYAVVFAMYTIIVSIFHTALYTTETIYFNHAIKSDGERISIQTVNGMVNVMSFALVGIVLPILMGMFYGQENMWSKIALIIGVPSMILGLVRYFCFKEVDIDVMEKTAQPISVKDAVTGLVTNKYVVMIAIIYFVVNLVGGFGSATTYYFQYIVGDVQKMSIINSFTFVALIIMPLCGALSSKFDKSKIMACFLFIGAIGNLIKCFAGANMFLLSIGSLLGGVVTYPVAIFGTLMLIDCMDYGEWKNKKRLEGAIFAATGLGSTIGAGVGSAFFGIIMNAFGYDGAAEVQTSQALFGIKLTFAILPVLFYVIAAVTMMIYDLEKKIPSIKEELNLRNAEL